MMFSANGIILSLLIACLFLCLGNGVEIDFREEIPGLNTRNIVLIGKSGAGKSALGNRLVNAIDNSISPSVFAEGSSIKSETLFAKSVSVTWDGIDFQIVDTPGLADNRADIEPIELISNMLGFLKNLHTGISVVLFCLPITQTRFDANDLEELNMLGKLLGEDVYRNTFIVLTQGDILTEAEKQKRFLNYKKMLPETLFDNGFNHFTEDQILRAEFTEFSSFVASLKKIADQMEPFKLKVPTEIDLENPESIEYFLMTPYVKSLLPQLIKLAQRQIDEFRNRNYLLENKIVKTTQFSTDDANPSVEQEKHHETVKSMIQEIEQNKIKIARTEKKIRGFQKASGQDQALLANSLETDIDSIHRVAFILIVAFLFSIFMLIKSSKSRVKQSSNANTNYEFQIQRSDIQSPNIEEDCHINKKPIAKPKNKTGAKKRNIHKTKMKSK